MASTLKYYRLTRTARAMHSTEVTAAVVAAYSEKSARKMVGEQELAAWRADVWLDPVQSKCVTLSSIQRRGIIPVSYTHLTLPTNREV